MYFELPFELRKQQRSGKIRRLFIPYGESHVWAFSMGVQQQEMNGCQYLRADNLAPSAVKLKKIEAGDEMQRWQHTPANLKGIEVPGDVMHKTSVVQSCL